VSGVERTTGAEAVAKILERAIEVIAEGGETAIRTNTIAYDCGTTPPVLYRAYGSREGLVVAAQAERYRRTMEYIASDLSRSFVSAESPDDLRARVRQGMAAAFSALTSSRPVMASMTFGMGGMVGPLLPESIRADLPWGSGGA
jgi:AcrR family transcriptional regulator